ncbi:MAG: biopolymer transporter ExbD [Pseudomonadota bacterium]
MALQRVRRRRRASITSLIDVIFLLLLFFMLSSTFSRFSELSVSGISEASAQAATSSESTIMAIEILPNGIRLEDEVVDDIVFRTRVDAQLAMLSGVTVRVDDAVKTQRLVDTLLLLNSFEGLKINLVDAS